MSINSEKYLSGKQEKVTPKGKGFPAQSKPFGLTGVYNEKTCSTPAALSLCGID